MKKKKLMKILIPVVSVVLILAIALPIIIVNVGGKKKEAIVIMTDELSGLFSPFYATSGTDMDVVGMTQIGMLSTDYNDKDGVSVKAGMDKACVVLDYEISEGDKPVYTFVIKNGLKFSDGEPLTMNDVMFNIYEYLDPVYTGSSTMYSIKIKGLNEYRTQTNGNSEEVEENLNTTASQYASQRVSILRDFYVDAARKDASDPDRISSATKEEVFAKIDEWTPTEDQKLVYVSETNAKDTSTYNDEWFRDKVKEDYNLLASEYKKELENDYRSSKEAFDITTAPYKEWADKLKNNLFTFFLYEGYITPEYADNKGKEDKTKIEKFVGEDLLKTYKTEEAAINFVYEDGLEGKFREVLNYSASASVLYTKFTADAKSILLQQNKENVGSNKFENISGVVSLGHLAQATNPATVTVNDKEYKIAYNHNEKGVPVNGDKTYDSLTDNSNDAYFDVLQITLEQPDPKAIYNFGFSVAPAHYYTAAKLGDKGEEIDIKNNKFGVKWGDSEFQSKVIQSEKNVSVPMGAGVYAATDANNNDNPSGMAFWNSGIVYFKANKNFQFEVKHEKMCMQVVTSSGAIEVLKQGKVDYITPQLTEKNFKDLKKLGSDIKIATPLQLGYGYIGINAGKVTNRNLRKAIMAAMNIDLASKYYYSDNEIGETCYPINWPMSTVSWAYPKNPDGSFSIGPKEYANGWSNVDDNTGLDYDAIDRVKYYTDFAKSQGATKNDFKITMTIAGASITEHPTYDVFKQAAEVLNNLNELTDSPDGTYEWNVEVKADSQALTKLSTGSLQVWAAAWGSTVDPDMYQVYHVNSSATSVRAWGYPEIKQDPTSEDYKLINDKLKPLIEKGRSIMDREERKAIYEEAMEEVLELAVELPVYQRSTLYAYNVKSVKGYYEEVNSYCSPLNEMWNLELV